jgi:hypothetical protein
MERIHAVILAALALSLLPAALTAGGERRAEVILVEHPEQLRILNQYQQALPGKSPADPFAPFVVVDPKATLSDGYTPCLRISCLGQEFFILSDDKGRLVGEQSAGLVLRLPHATIFDDSIAMLRSGSRLVSPGQGRPSVNLHPGNKLRRLFATDARLFVELQGQPSRFGWLTPEGQRRGHDWQLLEPEKAATPLLTPLLTSQLRGVIDRCNSNLSLLYEHFNRSAEHPLQSPVWRFRADGESARCVLQNMPAGTTYQETTRAIVKEFERILLGSGFIVQSTSDTITVLHRAD